MDVRKINECVNGTNVLTYELSAYSGDKDKTALLDALKQQRDASLQSSMEMSGLTPRSSRTDRGPGRGHPAIFATIHIV